MGTIFKSSEAAENGHLQFEVTYQHPLIYIKTDEMFVLRLSSKGGSVSERHIFTH